MLKPILSLKNITYKDIKYNDTTNERKKFYKNNNKDRKIESIDNFNDLNGVTSLVIFVNVITSATQMHIVH